MSSQQTDASLPAEARVKSSQPNSSITNEDVNAYFSPYVRVSPPWSVYEVIKTSICALTLLPFRIIFLALSGAFLWGLAALAMAGVPRSDREAFLTRPLHPVRKLILMCMFPLIRVLAFVCFGIVYIERQVVQDKRAASNLETEDAYVVVANHLGYVDIVVLLCRFRASFVSKGDLEKFPIIGTIAAASQSLFVRKNQSLTTKLVERVRATYECHLERQNCPGCPSCMSKIVIFPEGTTTNGTAMVAFRTGVFNAGVPVRPVCIEFPHKHFNMSWETIRFREHIFRTMTQIYNRVRMIELPVYVPSAEEKTDARLYASNVQKVMAEALQQKVVPLNREQKFIYHSYVLGKSSAAETLSKARESQRKDPQLQYILQNATMETL